MGLIACTNDLSSTSKEDANTKAMSPFDVNKYAINKLVCDPFAAQNENTTLDGGLQASLFYLTAGQPHYKNVGDMISNGKASGKNLFFSNVDVPTRLFNVGFPLETGGVVKTDEGADLFEYFALRMTGSFGLAADEPEGLYELAMLSDDGVIWTNTTDDANSALVSNDGDHPTRFGCGQIVDLKRDTRIASRIDYYQGPRYHIALVPMWRKVASGTMPGKDPQCGKAGNEMYFDYNNNSKPQQAYNDLLARGWKPLRAENWRLPQGTDYNPCYEDGQAPQVTELSVNYGSIEGSMVVSWQTDIPATDQVVYRNTATDVQMLTTSDNVLRTNHSITITGLQVGDIYEVQAVSISATLGRTVTPAVRVIAQ
ncbi:MAG: fibronectin type III domain-containing protein [Bdellovibrionales bacterium]